MRVTSGMALLGAALLASQLFSAPASASAPPAVVASARAETKCNSERLSPGRNIKMGIRLCWTVRTSTEHGPTINTGTVNAVIRNLGRRPVYLIATPTVGTGSGNHNLNSCSGLLGRGERLACRDTSMNLGEGLITWAIISLTFQAGGWNRELSVTSPTIQVPHRQ
ncbi:hypothetical protein ABGB12_23105 [Actinocorallia sp. B10E7]|uniref:hypothetical protein n=1 Tax=Actinocorallia sp. B10E7 TaxID=3153558 RepID=UPI00325CA006